MSNLIEALREEIRYLEGRDGKADDKYYRALEALEAQEARRNSPEGKAMARFLSAHATYRRLESGPRGGRAPRQIERGYPVFAARTSWRTAALADAILRDALAGGQAPTPVTA